MIMAKKAKIDTVELAMIKTGTRQTFDIGLAHRLLRREHLEGLGRGWQLPKGSPVTWDEINGFEPKPAKPKAEKSEAKG